MVTLMSTPGQDGLPETWTTRELPVLREIVRRFEDPECWQVRLGDLPAATGLDEVDVQRALRALDGEEPPYFAGTGVAELPYPLIITSVTGRARRAVGQWPASDSAVDSIVAALSAAADAEPDEEKRSGFRRAAAFVGDAGREVVYRVLTGMATGEISSHIPH